MRMRNIWLNFLIQHNEKCKAVLRLMRKTLWIKINASRMLIMAIAMLPLSFNIRSAYCMLLLITILYIWSIYFLFILSTNFFCDFLHEIIECIAELFTEKHHVTCCSWLSKLGVLNSYCDVTHIHTNNVKLP
jgi:hypothetical protein